MYEVDAAVQVGVRLPFQSLTYASLQADRKAFLEHALLVMLYLPSYATRARVASHISEGEIRDAEFVNNNARLMVRRNSAELCRTLY